MTSGFFRSLLGAMVFLPLLVPALSVPALGGTDFLIVEHPNRLIVYNKYQQEASEKERAALTPFVPMAIVSADDLLGDGFTRCMRVEIGSETYFLLKDGDGKLSRSGSLGYERTIKGARSVLDTIQVLADRSLRFTPIGSPGRELPVGEKAIRIFRHPNGTYCRTLGASPAYGWIAFGGTRESRDWKIVKTARHDHAEDRTALVRRIETRVTELNRLLTRLFEYFNAETHQDREPPRWEVSVSGTSIRCLLTGASRPEDFAESTADLAKELESIVMGTDLRVTRAPGKIDIR